MTDFELWEVLARVREQEKNGLFLTDVPIEDLSEVYKFYEVILSYQKMLHIENEKY